MARLKWSGGFLALGVALLGSACLDAAEPLDTLLSTYKTFGLPLPPKDAELAHLPGPGVSVRNGVRRQDTYVVLIVKRAAPNSRVVYWVGCDEGGHWHSIEFQPVKPEKAALETTVPVPVDHRDLGFPTYPDLALAIQCHAMGWRELATALHERSKQPPGRDPFRRRPPRPRDDQTALAELAWNYHCNQFVRGNADRQAIVAQMKKLLTVGPGLDTPARRNLVTDMQKTLTPTKAAPDTLEAALEGLADFQDRWGSFLGSGWGDLRNHADRHASYRKLQEAGLRAVPLLLTHIDDFRLTRRIQTNQDGSYTWHVRIADLVAQLLNGIAGEQFAYDFLEREGRGVQVDRAQVEDWRKKVGGTNELDYLRKNLERKDDGGRLGGNPAALQALGARYPAELIKLFEERQKTGAPDHNWFDALVQSKASDDDKARLLLVAAKKDDEWQQILALRALARMKHPDAKKLVIAALERQPVTPKEAYWTANVGNFAQIAAGIDDDEVWQVLLKTARRVDVGQRLQLLDWVGPGRNAARGDRAIRFYQAFLTDGEVRDLDSSKLFDGPGTAFLHKRIAVRDYAAEQLAHLLGMKVDVDSTWEEAQWKMLRERVEAELSKRLKSDK